MKISMMKRVLISTVALGCAFNANAASTRKPVSTTKPVATSQMSSSNLSGKKDAQVALTADPIYLLLGGLGLKGEYFVTDQVSVGVGGVLIPGYRVKERSNSTAETYGSYMYEHSEIYVGSNIMVTGTLTSDGVYLAPALGYQKTRVFDFGTSKLSGELSSPMAKMTVGYQWVLPNRIRLAAGGGLMVTPASDITVKDSSGAEVLKTKSSNLGGLALDLQVGYLF